MKNISIRTPQGQVCRIEVADTFATRGWGLLGRKGLQEGHGMWIKPCKSVHTFFMRFPIDVVYLDKNAAVTRVCHNVQPNRFTAGGPRAASVLELPAGSVAGMGVAPGQKLTLDV